MQNVQRNYRERNLRGYKELHKNCVVDKRKVEDMTITDCMVMYLDVIKHFQYKTIILRCKTIIRIFRENNVTNKWKETNNDEALKICKNVFVGYCEESVKQMVNIVLSSVRLAEVVSRMPSYEDNKENNEVEEVQKREKMKVSGKKETKTNVSTLIIGLSKFGDLKVGDCFMLMDDREYMCMKIETKDKGHFEDNTICLNDGLIFYTSEYSKVIRVNVGIIVDSNMV